MNLISISNLSKEEILRLLDSAEAFRARRSRHGEPLKGKSLAMIFEKPSTRTRVSLEVAAAELGGHPLYLSAGELQLGRGETIADTARVLSRFVHGITARVFSHNTVVQLAAHASVPVVNALSDWEHPLQILADMHGNVLHLGTRECTLQRKNQKLIEEAPAANIPEATRAARGNARLNRIKQAAFETADILVWKPPQRYDLVAA